MARMSSKEFKRLYRKPWTSLSTEEREALKEDERLYRRRLTPKIAQKFIRKYKIVPERGTPEWHLFKKANPWLTPHELHRLHESPRIWPKRKPVVPGWTVRPGKYPCISVDSADLQLLQLGDSRFNTYLAQDQDEVEQPDHADSDALTGSSMTSASAPQPKLPSRALDVHIVTYLATRDHQYLKRHIAHGLIILDLERWNQDCRHKHRQLSSKLSFNPRYLRDVQIAENMSHVSCTDVASAAYKSWRRENRFAPFRKFREYWHTINQQCRSAHGGFCEVWSPYESKEE